MCSASVGVITVEALENVATEAMRIVDVDQDEPSAPMARQTVHDEAVPPEGAAG